MRGNPSDFSIIKWLRCKQSYSDCFDVEGAGLGESVFFTVAVNGTWRRKQTGSQKAPYKVVYNMFTIVLRSFVPNTC